MTASTSPVDRVTPTRRTVLKVTGSTLLASVAFATTGAAANPHFIRASASGPDNRGDLRVSFKIAGLGQNVTTTVTASADASALYACINGGGKNPSAANKREETGRVEASGEFTSGRNGQITGSLTLSPPESTLECPPGQRHVLAEVTYTNVAVSEPEAGTESIEGTFSRTFLDL
ncbi:hypothetical protein ACFQH3_01085 [Haladaptatus sp. GCM10025707]|uniref:hypothetical protein n=1 Tax=Haladaptatus sp. QDMS2 TaxID=3033391 RepID=UPI0023E7DF62|nr:hypothetical protein [Haladaptatus sp. QDMS2]